MQALNVNDMAMITIDAHIERFGDVVGSVKQDHVQVDVLILRIVTCCLSTRNSQGVLEIKRRGTLRGRRRKL